MPGARLSSTLPTRKTTTKPARKAKKALAKKPAPAPPKKENKPKAPKRGPGQPTLLTPELTRKICDKLENGLSLKDAALLSGVGFSTLTDWQRWGREGKSPAYTEFSEAVERARAAAREKWVEALNSEATKKIAPDLGAARYMLAHSDPENYAERQNIDAKIEHQGGPTIVFRHIPANYKRK
ncbi:MAG: hypothetical protein LLG45_13115 [Actinomycetia bacterium]|nr:hypothetical protein [Actinomycetes bacterium]